MSCNQDMGKGCLMVAITIIDIDIYLGILVK